MRLRLPFISRRRYERELAAQQRSYQLALAEADARHKRLDGRTVSDVLEEHDVHRKAIADALGIRSGT